MILVHVSPKVGFSIGADFLVVMSSCGFTVNTLDLLGLPDGLLIIHAKVALAAQPSILVPGSSCSVAMSRDFSACQFEGRL